MVRFIRRTQSRELLGVSHPVKPAAVYDGTAHCRTMAIHVFCRGMCYDIGTPLNRTTVYRRREGIIHNQRNAMRMSHSGKLLDVQYRQCRIGNRLPENGPGILLERCVQFFFRSIR